MLEAKDQGHNADGISKKVFASKFGKFSENFKRSSEKKCLQKFFRKPSCVLQDETKLIMTLAHFQQVKI